MVRFGAADGIRDAIRGRNGAPLRVASTV